jgi:hypothetical protein
MGCITASVISQLFTDTCDLKSAAEFQTQTSFVACFGPSKDNTSVTMATVGNIAF